MRRKRVEIKTKTVDYKHTLKSIDYIIQYVNNEWFNDLEESDSVYVYLKSFPDDEILTEKYYQNCGRIYNDQRDDWILKLNKDDWKIENADNSEVWEVCIMSLKELKDLLLREKGMQVMLEQKYPGIIYDN